MEHEVSNGCLECVSLKNHLKDAVLALGRHAESHIGSVKDTAYIKKESELIEANNKAHRAFSDHRDREHGGAAFA